MALTFHSTNTSLFFSILKCFFFILVSLLLLSNCWSAHTAAPRTKKDVSFSSKFTNKGINDLFLLFPAAIQQFLKNLSLPILLIGEPLNFFLNSWSESFNNSFKLKLYLFSLNWISFVFFAYLFHGQTAKQSSQPNILLPMADLNSYGITFLCSIVKYEIHFEASNLFSP